MNSIIIVLIKNAIVLTTILILICIIFKHSRHIYCISNYANVLKMHIFARTISCVRAYYELIVALAQNMNSC